MDKLLDNAKEGEWEVSLIDDGPLEKTAAASEVLDFVNGMVKEEGKFYLHINAMGAGEYYGSNRNGDYFPEENLLKWYKTFETSPAHVFRHHVNKDPAKSIGKVIYSYYNPRMHRVELVAELDKVKAAPEYLAISDGKYPMTSMACHTPFDVCSVCGNKAHSRAEYCSHLSTQLNTIMPDGKKVMAMNLGPLKFFDISIVIRPADVTSSVLQKVASDAPTIGSIEAAEADGISYNMAKKASIKKEAVEKLADFIKEIPSEVDAADDNLLKILDRVRDPEIDIVTQLKDYSLADIIKTFAYMGISPSVEFLLKILVSKYVGEHEDTITALALDALKTYGFDSIPESAGDLVPDLDDATPNPVLMRLLWKHKGEASYHEEDLVKRASDGYINWQVGRSPVEPSKIRMQTSNRGALLTLVGSAVLAKMMISKLTSGFTKAAGVTTKLMDLSIARDLEKYK